MVASPVEWRVHAFDALTRDQLYAILAARVAVFVVEQDCPYQDVDGLDAGALHVSGWSGDELAAYARLLGPGVRFAEPSIGRVLTTSAARRRGLGRELMVQSLDALAKAYPAHGVRISAQHYLEDFYAGFGFATVRGPYPEDGIPHLEMLRPPESAAQRRQGPG